MVRPTTAAGSLHGLAHAAFGQYVLAKIGLLAVLVALGAVNRYRSVPALNAGGSARSLQRVGRTELVCIAVGLVATAILQGLAPPTTVSGAPRPVVLTASDFATTVTVRLTITPGMAGFNVFSASVDDYDARTPIRGASVTLRVAQPGRPDLGSSELALAAGAPGVYAAAGPNLSIDATWDITLTLERPAGGVEVDFMVTPRVSPTRLVVTHEGSGLPTLYTLDISGGRSIQTYLDPGRTGVLNEFHTTFIGPGGQEIPMAALSDTVVGPTPGTAPFGLPVRRLDTIGHFVADLSAAETGPYKFEFKGTTTAGTVIDGSVTIPVR